MLALTGTGPIRPTGLPMFATLDTFEDYSDSRAVQLLASYKFREIGDIPRNALRTAIIVGILFAVAWTAWTHLDIYYRHGGAMALTGGAMKRLITLTPTGFEARIDLTITDEHPMAQAFVIISAVPLGAGSS